MQERKKTLVEQHIDRCIEMYGMPMDSDFKKTVSVQSYEQMRADLMILVGIAAALAERSGVAHD
jgi:hypothetical protein